ncbi:MULTISPECIES: bifunctional diaminohydroxyphosphoribosylaminopyrimidine deaminase/5-amino-6-(5-phosphoribosylamino)uracil reductase RibD [unclassified Vibrio]|uniref:bifunctional diaminohydroxyphosphoribosylaminopyrimidine deaminase/5-amino-6-(5-phosphoribosylamino)uracil reductase RibD n=1 Tax=unclassified Vibrio TaxID=2614977 RepID=UPI0014821DAE|nr:MULTISPECIES: bifunctional diaminohydroxyphosphoribosylaminopyrimidine deaminase/5-amino-6-(5-phosphoribosylamino)uracil reductase RibD [unclassified Vibrio]NNN43122.1 bifunctional diaminohydroxyphosphoribosylaminopyrimidine deaminase/5-amino-6-(5-phosphoribosylamino)uracil reductase RibD [Vibrio sp. 1-1(7)]NNN73974.1 bifunctional diaminohydroxyphosphoribosylaminopyrimidine deaminase/5-amino-6-(5-phosphoribosylamino)uracil reductase RibD [Vibrio sp. 12-2(3-a)]
MPNFTAFDYQMMAYALKLAERGRFTTAPNPNVGCVITRGDKVVGEGFHYRAGQPHAEVHALRMAGDQAQGATAYVTLEPCSHYGRTPPCAKGLINAGVSKVICAMQDPNPQVSGRGIAMLRAANIEVVVGLLEREAKALNFAFIKRMQTGMPFVQLKLAASLDGQTALANGCSQWITSSQARQDVQVYRAQAGALLSTSQTVLSDSASLAVRWSELPSELRTSYPECELRQPTRVILDRQHQLHSALRLYQVESPVLRVAQQQAEVCVELDQQGRLDLRQTLATLALQENINHLWVEAGATLANTLLAERLVDELIVYLAPKIMGSDGRGLFGTLGLTEMEQVPELEIKDCRMIGPDLRLTATLKQ